MHATGASESSIESADDTARRSRLRADIDAAAALPGIDGATLGQLRDKLASRTFNLVVAGEFKRGKSSIINALVGADLLPTAVVPLTSIVTILRHAAAPAASATFNDDTRRSIPLEAIADYVTERGNPGNRRQVREVEVGYPAPWLGQGIRLIDTPGIGSAYQHNSDVTFAYLPQADAVIFVTSVDQPVSRSELKFLADIHGRTDRVFCLLNKIDHLTSAELAESVAFATAILQTVLGDAVHLFPVSARVAIDAAHRSPEDEATAGGGFAALNAALRQFLARDSGSALLHSIRRHLVRVLAARRLAAELELKALEVPLATLEANLRAFAGKKTAIAQQVLDVTALLDADAKRLVRDVVEPAIAEFKADLAQSLDAHVPEWTRRALLQRDLPPQRALEAIMVANVRRAYDAFRQRQDRVVATQFDAICDRFRKRIEQSVDELLAYSAHLFDIRFDTVAAEPLHAVRSHFYYKFWQEHDSMGLLADTFTGWLPRNLQRPLLLRHARHRVAELVEMQAGRMRHDLDARVVQAVGVEHKQMRERSDATVAGIESAIAKGRALQTRDKRAADARREDIGAVLAAIDVLSKD